jgi:hypothetical protein
LTDLVAAVTAGTAIGLVVLTAAYVWYTRRMVTELRATREQTEAPALWLAPLTLGPRFPAARLTNVGTGHALDVQGSIEVLVGGTTMRQYELRLPQLAPSEFRVFVPYVDENEQNLDAGQFADEGRVFRCQLHFSDAFMRTYDVDQAVDWQLIRDHVWGAGLLLDKEPLTEIERHLEKIAKKVDQAIDAFDGVRVTTYAERRRQSADRSRALVLNGMKPKAPDVRGRRADRNRPTSETPTLKAVAGPNEAESH